MPTVPANQTTPPQVATLDELVLGQLIARDRAAVEAYALIARSSALALVSRGWE